MHCPRCGFDNPAEYAFCGQCGEPLSSTPRTTTFTAGERRLVTAVFACIPELETLSETTDPERARLLINGCIEALSAPIYKFGGIVDKLVGQELMAVFGALESHEDDPARALWAAVEMIAALEQFNLTNADRLSKPFSIHFGVNTGLVFAGEVGAPGLRTFTVIGDAVNLASRLAHLAGPSQVFVGESTYDQARRFFRFRPLPPITVRGRLEAVSIYVLMGTREGYRRAWGVSGLSSPMVGREEEAQALQGCLRRLQAGQGEVVTIVGEAGIGKSRLVAEARSMAQELRWLEGRSLSFQSQQVYSPFRYLIQRYLNIEEATPLSGIRDRLQEMITQFVPDQQHQIYPFLWYLLGLPPDKASAEILDPLSAEGLQSGFFRAMRSLLGEMARDRPMVVVMEDLHWADESSLTLLTSLMPLTLDAPILFLTILRPDPKEAVWQIVREAAERAFGYSEIRLSPLSWKDGDTLISNLLQGGSLSPTLRRRILEKAEGNPLFVEEIIHSLVQDDVLVLEGDEWRATREEAVIFIPDTLRGLLASRVDRLDPPVRQTLRRAAVVGRVFSERVLAAMSEEPAILGEHLRLLLDRNFVRYYRLEGEQGKAYIFNHALTHEVAYEGILRDERRHLHRRVFEVMERLYLDRLEAHYATLAQHAYLGALWETSVSYLCLAGDRAKEVYALSEATRYYQRAMGLLQEHDFQWSRQRLSDLYHECCSAHIQLGNRDTARAVCNVLMEMGSRQDDPYLRGHALRGMALIFAHTGDAVAHVATARAACLELAAARAYWSLGTTLLLLAFGLFKLGHLDEAGIVIEEGLHLVGDARRWPGYDPRSEALFYAGLIELMKGQLKRAIGLFGKSEGRARKTGEQVFVGSCQAFIGLAYGFLGEYNLALEKIGTGAGVGESWELPAVAGLSFACGAWVHTMAGHYGNAVSTAHAVLEQKTHAKDVRAIAHVALGDAYLGLLDLEAGLAHHQKVLEVAGLSHVATTSAIRGIGLAHILMGKMDEGMVSLQNSLAAATTFGLAWFRTQTLRDIARASLAIGDRAAALEWAEQLVTLSEEADYRELLGWGWLLRGRATEDVGDIRRGTEMGQYLRCWPLQWEGGEALAHATGDETALKTAQIAVQAIADGLQGHARSVFLENERVQYVLKGKIGSD